jgi:calcineurin-like phosphoesterase family protein
MTTHATKSYLGASFAKPHRETGDPVSPAAEHARFVPPPPFTAQSLTLPLEAILPGITEKVRKAGSLSFHSLGDTGGVRGTEMQEAIAEAMQAQIDGAAAGKAPLFYYHLGDVIYFNGQSENYVSQFYEPYQHYSAPIFAIPGNHDGDTTVHKGDLPDNEPSLYGFMLNFCSPKPEFLFKYRQTMTQPYCYWKLEAPFVHIIGLYSNVDGQLDARGTSQQQNWFVDQLKATPQDKWLVVAVHHPCYSLDSAHGGYQETLDALDLAFKNSGRHADVLLHGHVHNYQRFSRAYAKDVSIPYIIAGAGGYALTERSLHKLQKGLKPSHGKVKTTLDGVVLEHYDTTNSGFLTLTADPAKLTIDYYSVTFNDPPKVSDGPADSVVIEAGDVAKTA